MNIDYSLLEKQRDHLLSILWHDFKPAEEREDQPVPLDRELGLGYCAFTRRFIRSKLLQTKK